MKRVPILPTLLVLIAVGVMLRLGFWQIDRLHQKEAMLAQFEAAQSSRTEIAFPVLAQVEAEAALYHRSRLDCSTVLGVTVLSGRNAHGEAGLAHVAKCQTPEGGTETVVMGWSRNPTSPAWSGGIVTGTVAPGPRLVADPQLAGLEANAKPDPHDIANNHLAYAVQWFLFAGIALVIYGLALRKRWRG